MAGLFGGGSSPPPPPPPAPVPTAPDTSEADAARAAKSRQAQIDARLRGRRADIFAGNSIEDGVLVSDKASPKAKTASRALMG